MGARTFLRGLKAGMGFATTLPMGEDGPGFDFFFGHIYYFALIGIAIGAILGALGLAFQWLLPPPLVPVLAISAIYLLTGINHLDGLSDFGDGLIAHGPREKKLAALKDAHAGAGGILFIGLDLLFLYAAISMFAAMGGLFLLAALVVAESCAKACLATAAAFGKSLSSGMGKALMDRARPGDYLAGLAIAAIACAGAAGLAAAPLPSPRCALAGLLALSASVGLGFFVAGVAERSFGGVNGDALGAANEIGRIAALVVLGVLAWMPW